MLPPRQHTRIETGDPPDFKPLLAPEDSDIDFGGTVLMIPLQSNWSPEGAKEFKAGSIIYVNAHKFVSMVRTIGYIIPSSKPPAASSEKLHHHKEPPHPLAHW
mmetsp:Transcript_21241/g.59120  ORF Transcript_21241/g.59120 Transcript_21241/m.59120 type:complete len:103 (-) Transcript_21241:570-878(-)